MIARSRGAKYTFYEKEDHFAVWDTDSIDIAGKALSDITEHLGFDKCHKYVNALSSEGCSILKRFKKDENS